MSLRRGRSPEKQMDQWDAAMGQAALTLKGHTDPVMSVAWSLDSRRINTSPTRSQFLMFRSRLNRLERRLIQCASAEANHCLKLTPEKTVSCIRALLSRYETPDPFPLLEGTSYIDAFSSLYEACRPSNSDIIDHVDEEPLTSEISCE
jgi:hypothetical protein